MIGALTDEPGYFVLTIDGDSFRLPKGMQPDESLRLTQSDLASGGVSAVGIFGGAGMPNVLSSIRLPLAWDTDDTCGELTEALESLAASGVARDLAYWKQRICRYTLAESQQVIYLPRRDAFAAGYPEFSDAGNELAATLNGTPLTTAYQTTVEESDSVPSGQIWVSETAIDHPDTGKPNVVRCKIGDAPSDGDSLVVKFFPLYRVLVVQASTAFSFVGREDKAFTFVEVDD